MNAIRRLFLLLLLVLPRPAAADDGPAAAPDATRQAIAAALAEARARGCENPANTLDHILCAGVVRIGVRANYPGFGVASAAEDGGVSYKGYDVDVAQEIARRLGERMEPIGVNPGNRIAMAAEGQVDMVVATMAHSVSRDKQVTFIRPHYYGSATAVIASAALHLPDLASLAGRTVCVPLGAASNGVLARHGARLMLFDQPQHLLDALRFGRCAVVTHDESFFVEAMSDPAFAAQFAQKFTFSPGPWGIGIAQQGSAELAHLLGLLVTDFHRSGLLVGLAARDGVPGGFLAEQARTWSRPDCILADGDPSPACMLKPIDDVDAPTSFAGRVAGGEAWLQQHLGLEIHFPMLKGQAALALFRDGIVNSLLLVFGAILATVGFALVFQYGLRHRWSEVRIAAGVLTMLLQSSPIVLLLILGYFITTALLTYDTGVAMGIAVAVIGLANGSFAGSAMADAARVLAAGGDPAQVPLRTVLRRSATQLTSFIANAARASAVASFIGTPELLTSLTEIASVTSERRTTFTLLLIFYLIIVMTVVGLSGLLTRWLTAPEKRA